MGDNPQAIADLTIAIELRPNYALNYKNRAKAYELIGKKALAAADLKAAKACPPTSLLLE
jgi:tetratricopeptide (TPR) repeat protein